jgi:hypothetical protein
LLDVSKADDGRISNNPKVVNIVTFLREIVEGLEQKAADKGLRLTYKPLPDGAKERHIAPVYYVNQDNDHIREVINNLIENAIKYTLAGDIVVDVTGDDDHVVISVKDSGIGIPAEDIPHLFQKFYRVDNKDTRSINGTGLGLYLCRRLIEIMGGRIWAESIYGSGSTFYVELARIGSQQATILLEQQDFKAKQEAQTAAAMQAPVQPATMPIIQPQQQQPTVQPQTFRPAPMAPAQPVRPPVMQPNIATPQYRAVRPVTAPESQRAAPVSAVPRSQSLTPKQIADYVARQRELARQQAMAQANNRPQTPTTTIGGPGQ